MDIASLLQDLKLGPAPSDMPRPSRALPPITELLSQLWEKLIGSAEQHSESCSVIGAVEQLFRVADPDWLFSPASEEGGWAELQAAHRALVCALIGCADLPLCEEGGGSPSAAAYQDVPSRAAAVSSALTVLLETLGRWTGCEGAGLLLALAPPICVFAVTHFQDAWWTTPTSRAAARSLQGALLRAGRRKDSAHLLSGDGDGAPGILGGVLDILQPQLGRDAVERRPAAALLFAWTLLQIRQPVLSPLLPRLLPPSLLLNDHYRPENCMLGVQCLHHIVLNTPPADLLHFNRAELLYQALFKHLYSSEAAVIQLVLSCLLDLLLVLEKPPSSSSSSSSSSRLSCRHDDVLRLVLTRMEAEQQVALRRVFAAALPPYIDRMGVAVCRHLRRLERVVLGYLEVGDPPEESSRLSVLEALQRASRAAWPRLRRRAAVLLRPLLRLLVDVSSDPRLKESVRQSVTNQTLLCMRLLDACSHGDVQRLLQNVDSSCCSSQLIGYLATVTTTTER
ncbi:TELO2-interacting protein 2 [Salarias fasciatus]|uniref:TELO2-interacting protein 2 n=1 Tax=Salarias fasciatus TaxID=181472 RepID=UPI001176C47F|nr:TELO2-interacting protein 2 [Salarias fasciatus]